ncbi:MAG TPA: XRE family transcriptional regulator [Gammaproteobacteria bacterium]|nr:XRE family transcriptional regulator [Gammaproteobacteria bacterium]
MITPKQIRAARNFLGIDQKTLADAVGVSKMNISDIENEKGKPRASTLNTIELYFQTCGIRLTPAGGIEPAQNFVTIYEGEDCYFDLLLDVHATLKRIKGRMLCSGSDERRSSEEVICQLRKMRSDGIIMQSLIEPGNTYIMGKLEEYRWMPTSLFVDGDVKVIYADRVAYLVSWAGTPRVIVIQDKTIAEEASRHFDFIWIHSKQPNETTSQIFYEDRNGEN